MTYTLASLKADLAALLERCAILTGDDDLRRAASAVRGKLKVGRPRKNDDAAISEVKLMAADGALPVLTASRHVAKTITTLTYTTSTARRLARKVAAQNKLSAAQNILSVDLDSDVA
jgi:hypothetical protein